MVGRVWRRVGVWLRANAPFSFMNNEDEWHSFVVGVGEGFFFLASLFHLVTPAYLLKEPHYYRFGQAVGFAAFLWTIAGIVSWLT